MLVSEICWRASNRLPWEGSSGQAELKEYWVCPITTWAQVYFLLRRDDALRRCGFLLAGDVFCNYFNLICIIGRQQKIFNFMDIND